MILNTRQKHLCSTEFVECTILVPIEKLYLTVSFDVGPYRFIPAIGYDDSGAPHPWHNYLSPSDAETIWNVCDSSESSNGLRKSQDACLLTYPLVEVVINIPYRELLTAEESADGSSPLLRRCSEAADRAVDLLRLDQCHYTQHERLPGIAGQLLSGFHAAYVIPLRSCPFKPKLYCHFASPFQVTPNWLGLDVDYELSEEVSDLAPIVFGTVDDEMSQRVRGAIRALGQAFYMLTPEVRFLSLITAIDGLCAPEKNWKGLTYCAYIAAVGAGGNSSYFKVWLRKFSAFYTEIRNPIVHKGGSFIELGIEPAKVSNDLMSFIVNCVRTILYLNLKKSTNFQEKILSTLESNDFQKILIDFSDFRNLAKKETRQIEKLLKISFK